MKTLAEWLEYLERLHPKEMDLGLERVARVRDTMGLDAPPFRSIVIGGTNGKGACTVLLDAALRAAGHRPGRYLSPHIRRYNERVAVDGVEAGDDALCAAFEAVERARGDTTLTYFEFGTLAALECFRRAGCDWAVLEVGLGGRLDATNILEPEAALVASVGIDHTDWLGEDRESIGHEKAGIYRPGRPAVCADPDPPASLVRHAETIGAVLVRAGRDYGHEVHADGTWTWCGAERWPGLPRPALTGDIQYANAAAVAALVHATPSLVGIDRAAFERGLTTARLPGRLQVVSGRPPVVLDIAHNPAAVAVLAAHLVANPVAGRDVAVCAMLADKRIAESLHELDPVIGHWIFAGLESAGARGLDAATMLARARAAGLSAAVESAPDVTAAMQRARSIAGPDDRIVVFGSFHTIAAALD